MISATPIQTFVTFGQQYAYEPHPTFPEAHPDGILAVAAETYGEARELISEAIGVHYAFDYPVGPDLPSRLHPEYYPRGICHILDASGIRRVE